MALADPDRGTAPAWCTVPEQLRPRPCRGVRRICVRLSDLEFTAESPCRESRCASDDFFGCGIEQYRHCDELVCPRFVPRFHLILAGDEMKLWCPGFRAAAARMACISASPALHPLEPAHADPASPPAPGTGPGARPLRAARDCMSRRNAHRLRFVVVDACQHHHVDLDRRKVRRPRHIQSPAHFQ